MRWLLVGSTAVLVGLLANRGANLLTRVVVGRALGPHDLGVVATVWSLVSTLSELALAGLAAAITRFLAQYQRDAAYASAKSLLVETVLWALGVSVAMSLAVVLLAKPIAGMWLDSYQFTGVVRIGAVAMPVSVMVLWYVAVFRGFGEASPAVVTKDFTNAAVTVALLAVLALTHALTIRNVLWLLYVIPVFVSCVVGAALIWPRILPLLRSHVYRSDRLAWLTFAWPLSLSMLLRNTAGRGADVLILGYVSSASEVGIYVSALSAVGLLALVLRGVSFLALPLFAERDGGERSQNMRDTRTLTIAATLPVSVILMLWPGFVSNALFGGMFSAAVNVIPMLTLGFVLANFFGPIGQLLLAEGKTRWHLLADLSAIVTFVLIAVSLGPSWGAFGVAVASAFSQAAFNAVAAMPNRKVVLDLPPGLWGDVVGVCVGLGALKLGALWATRALSASELWDGIFVAVAVCAGYAWVFSRRAPSFRRLGA